VSSITFNIAKGRVIELYSRVKGNDPSTSALVLVPIETSGLEAEAVVIDADTLAAVIAGTTNEQTTMGKKILTDAELAALPTPTDASDYYEVSLPTVTWTAATGNPISRLVVCYEPNTGTSTNSTLVPLTWFDFVQTPSGSDIQMTTGVFFRAS
jgi:hypothetical protein